MDSKEIIKALEPWMEKVRRPAWRPVVERGDGDPAASKFCGMPWTGPGSPWPLCSACEAPLTLCLQLQLDDLPDPLGERYGPGLLQLFYCTRGGNCPGMGGFDPFEDEVSRVRIIRPTPRGEAAPPPADHESLPAHRIVGWKRFDDLPTVQESEEHGLRFGYDYKAGTIRLECPELGFDASSPRDKWQMEEITDSASKDKLAGWPMWVQGIEYPSCPRCRQRMILVFQLGSHDHVDFPFGDGGTGHITQCPEHKDVVAFGWACG